MELRSKLKEALEAIRTAIRIAEQIEVETERNYVDDATDIESAIEALLRRIDPED